MNNKKQTIGEATTQKKLMLNKRTIVKFSSDELKNFVGGKDGEDVTFPTQSHHDGPQCTSVQKP